MKGYQSLIQVYIRTNRHTNKYSHSSQEVLHIAQTISFPCFIISSLSRRISHAAVAAGLRVSSFLGALLVGADVEAAAGLFCVPPPLLFAGAFNFLGFFLSTVFEVVVDCVGAGLLAVACCGFAAGFVLLVFVVEGACFCDADLVVGPVDVPFALRACFGCEEVFVLAVGACLGFGASLGLDGCCVLDVFCCFGACSLCFGWDWLRFLVC